jgi:hypothetical protein
VALRKWLRGRRAVIGLLLGAALIGPASAASGGDPQLAAIASEARGAIAVIDWFYADHHACPQPSRAEELAASLEPRGEFTEIRSIAMAEPWLYYTSPDNPGKCTLWRKLGWDPALIWRRHREGATWVLDPGDGGPERRVKFTP